MNFFHKIVRVVRLARFSTVRFWSVLFVSMLLLPLPSFAYFGPGGGLTAIGALLALIAAVFYTFFGFFWYPIKRWLKRRKAPEQPSNPDQTAEAIQTAEPIQAIKTAPEATPPRQPPQDQ